MTHNNELIDITYLIDSFSESLGIETAEKIVYESVDEAGLSRKRYYTNNEFVTICEKLISRGGYIRSIAELVLKSTSKDTYYRTVIDRERKEKEDLIRLKAALEEKTKELEAAMEKMKQMQEQIIRSEKFAAIGKLASVVGHELRNPLTSLKNIAYYFQKVHHFEDQKVSQLVQLLSNEVDRANRIVSDLLDFARIKKHNKVLVDIEKLVNNTLEKIPLPENINIVKDIMAFQANIDPDKFAHILTNLVANARDAISGEGEIQVSVKKSGECIEMVVSDNGCGMDEETVKHIFDPLFTTKAKGLGLGLTIVKDIVDADNGKIEVKSEKGKGTTFKIILSA